MMAILVMLKSVLCGKSFVRNFYIVTDGFS